MFPELDKTNSSPIYLGVRWLEILILTFVFVFTNKDHCQVFCLFLLKNLINDYHFLGKVVIDKLLFELYFSSFCVHFYFFGYSYDPNTGHTEYQIFVYSGVQMVSENGAICQLDLFRPFKYRSCPVFGSSLYFHNSQLFPAN